MRAALKSVDPAGDAVTILANAQRLHLMAAGTSEQRKFHRDRVSNARHQIATENDGTYLFAPVKWSCVQQASIQNYKANKEPNTSFFIDIAKSIGFSEIRAGAAGWSELYNAYNSYCNRFGFDHSDAADRVFYVLEGSIFYADEAHADSAHWEGSQKSVLVNKFERNSAARRLCIAQHGHDCAVCGFSFEANFGDLGRGYIHVHHRVPFSEIRREYVVDPIKDLVPVCPNCHMMLHQRVPALSVDELKMIIARVQD